jgi:hypothetical protein
MSSSVDTTWLGKEGIKQTHKQTNKFKKTLQTAILVTHEAEIRGSRFKASLDK